MMTHSGRVVESAVEMLAESAASADPVRSRLVTVRLPVAARPLGVALVFDPDGASPDHFSIRVHSAPSGVPLQLGPYGEDEVVAIWRSIAASSGLPLLVEGPDGALQQPYRQLGRLVLGTSVDPRRHKVLTGRRPRFLVRRKASRMPSRPIVHRERQIAEGRAV